MSNGMVHSVSTPELVEFKHIMVPAQVRQLAVLRGEVRRCLVGVPLTESAVSALIHVVDDAATDAVEHACAPTGTDTVELAFWFEPGAVCFVVVDHRCPSRSPEHATDHDRSIPLICRGAVIVRISHGRRGTRVYIRQTLDCAWHNRAFPDREFPVGDGQR